MDVEVMSRDKFEKYVFNSSIVRKPCYVISISSFGSAPPCIFKTIYNNIQQSVELQFNDTDSKDIESGGITEEDAARLAQTLKDWGIGLKSNIIVHCDAGISRSSGVAAAILKYYTGNDERIFNSEKYVPNMLCYNSVLKALTNEN